MKKIIIVILAFCTGVMHAQQTYNTADDYFYRGAKMYCNEKSDEALATVEEGLSKFPQDKKLKELYDKLKKKQDEEKKKKEEQQKQQQNQNQKQQNQNNQQQNQQQQNQGNNEAQKKQQQQQSAGQMGDKQAEQMLEAISADEAKTQEKVNKQKVKPVKGKVLKDW